MPFGAAHWPYIIILLVVVLIIWGPGKLPDLGAGMGRAIREFRKASSEVQDHVVKATTPEPPAERPAETQPAAAAPAGEVKEERPTTV